MRMPPRIVAIVKEFVRRNPELANGTEDQRRSLTKMIGEQVRFELGDKWGIKASGPSAPQSKDTIAFLNDDGTIDVWDWQNGSTREVVLKENSLPDFPSVPQFWITITGKNHLNVGVDEPPVDNPPDSGESNVAAALLATMSLLQQLVQGQKDILDAINNQTIAVNRTSAEIKALSTTGVKVRF